jgi:hypothetical protein
MSTFVVKKIIKTEVDEGKEQSDKGWSAKCDSSTSEDKLTLLSDNEFEFNVGDELELKVIARQQQLA